MFVVIREYVNQCNRLYLIECRIPSDSSSNKNVKSVLPHTAAEGGPRPAPAGEARDRALPDQSVSSVAAHLTASAQRAPVGPPPGGVAGHLSVSEARGTTPVRVCV